MAEPIAYRRHDKIAVITMDDGKVNSISLDKLAALRAALDRAESDQCVVLLTGRPERFCAGFDLKAIKQGGEVSMQLVRSGFELLERLLSFPTPVVIACNGHALAMGAFLLLAADLRLGAAGAYKIGANEVAIGLPVPQAAIELCRFRLAPTHFARSLLNAEIFSPEEAVRAGYLDQVLAPDDLMASAERAAQDLAALNMNAYRATKQRVRAINMKMLREAIEVDAVSWRVPSA